MTPSLWVWIVLVRGYCCLTGLLLSAVIILLIGAAVPLQAAAAFCNQCPYQQDVGSVQFPVTRERALLGVLFKHTIPLVLLFCIITHLWPSVSRSLKIVFRVIQSLCGGKSDCLSSSLAFANKPKQVRVIMSHDIITLLIVLSV